MSLFITATGTDIGKTFVATALIRGWKARGLSIGAYKPIVSGVDPADPAGSDPALMLEALGTPVTTGALDRIAPWRFQPALSPDMAAEREGQSIDYSDLLIWCRKAANGPQDRILIEGAGGVMVPINRDHLFRDLIADLKMPALVVAGSYLGTISHTLSTLEALHMADIPVAGVVVSESENSPVPLEETIAAMERFVWSSRFFGLPRRALSEGDAVALSEFADQSSITMPS